MLRGYRESDAAAVSLLALAGFEEFRTAYSDWAAMSASIAQMPSLASVGELIVAELDGDLVGAVTYVSPDRPKAPFFEPHWPIVRMLVVHPAARGRGVGRALMDECCRRAWRDNSRVLALHTSPIMTTALAMYRDMGFVFQRDAPPIYGVPSAVYLLEL
jgi:ribosomal protein S18 acetylase RimI-like enzyme